VAARIRKPRDLFTASQIARFCQVDLKTIHNWADRGQIPHFRTPGRHLRFRRPHVLDFLRKYGYPIPDELDAGRPRVVLLTNGVADDGEVAATLESSFDVIEYLSPVVALLQMGEQPPDAIVLAADLDPLSPADVIQALSAHERTRHVRAILVGNGEDKDRALGAGASAYVRVTDLEGLRDTLEALMGVRH
jgi:excisionase family DNA binding protein